MAFDTNTSGIIDRSKITIVRKKRLIVKNTEHSYVNSNNKFVTRIKSKVYYSSQEYTVRQYNYNNPCSSPSESLRSCKANELSRRFAEQKTFNYSKQTRPYINSTEIVSNKMNDAINKHNDRAIKDNMRKFNYNIKYTRISNDTYEKRLVEEVLLIGTIGLDTERLTRTQKRALGLI